MFSVAIHRDSVEKMDTENWCILRLNLELF